MGTPSFFSCIFSKSNNFHDFLFASLETEALLIGDQLLMEKLAPVGANSHL